MLHSEKINLLETQDIEFNLLQEFVEFCKKNNLRYSLIGGTLLGAVRHKGFIPWDDDIDVMMPRIDYDFFVSNFISSKSHLLNADITRYYCFPFSKLISSKTKGNNSDLRKIKEYGVYIDIFPVDNMINDLNVFNHIVKKNQLIAWERICRYSKNDWWKVVSNKNFFYSSILSIFNLFRGLYWRYFKSYKKEYEKHIKHIYEYNFNDQLTFYYDTKWPSVTMDDFESFEYKKFRDLDCKVIKNWDYWLKMFYGDYMEIPKKDKQVSHHHHDFFYK